MTSAFIRAMQTPKGVGQTALKIAELLQTPQFTELVIFIRTYKAFIPYWIALGIALPPPPTFEQFIEVRQATLILLNTTAAPSDPAALHQEYLEYLREIEAHQERITPRVIGQWKTLTAQFAEMDEWSGGIASWVFMLVAELIAPSPN